MICLIYSMPVSEQIHLLSIYLLTPPRLPSGSAQLRAADFDHFTRICHLLFSLMKNERRSYKQHVLFFPLNIYRLCISWYFICRFYLLKSTLELCWKIFRKCTSTTDFSVPKLILTLNFAAENEYSKYSTSNLRPLRQKVARVERYLIWSLRCTPSVRAIRDAESSFPFNPEHFC